MAAAERQKDDATRTLKDYSISPQERRAAETRQAAGNIQINLLLRGAEGQGSDFYVYRYLATEGFLPGYNFPRLPLMAFVPGGQGGKGQRYLQRARFLAIAEFGPGSLVYHEGRAYRVDRALLEEAGGGQVGNLPTFSTAICPMCGAGHDSQPPEQCHVCRHPLSGANITCNLHRIENVGTRQVERITANDEERRRQGYDLQTTFSFHNASGIKSGVLEDALGEIIAADFAPAALVRRINRGLRRRKDASSIGFVIDPKSGYWVARPVPKTRVSHLRRVPSTPYSCRRGQEKYVAPSLSHKVAERGRRQRRICYRDDPDAPARGVEAVYQLEEGEILGEPTPSRKERRALLFYEAAEGGAGALSRLAEEKSALRTVARMALEIMHYDPGSIEDAAVKGPSALVSIVDARCVAGCYRCLLSYFNQPDHQPIDRRQELALQFLLRLAFADAQDLYGELKIPADLDGCPAPDPQPFEIDGYGRSDLARRKTGRGRGGGRGAPKLGDKLAAKGVELILLPSEKNARSQTLVTLAAALGAKPP